MQLNDPDQLAQYPEMEKHFNRSREMFYYAESLRNFPRDSVDPGAFDEIRDEIYHGVVNIYEMDYADRLQPHPVPRVTHAGNADAELQRALHSRADEGQARHLPPFR